MVKHVVTFRFEGDLDERREVARRFRETLLTLPDLIDVLQSMEVGLNINPAETWSIALYSEFDTLDDVRQYAVHPDHVAAGKLLAEVKESRACVDYEL